MQLFPGRTVNSFSVMAMQTLHYLTRKAFFSPNAFSLSACRIVYSKLCNA